MLNHLYDNIDYTTYLDKDNLNNNDLYEYFCGTSAAAPHVSGLIALLRADNGQDWNQAGEPLEPEDYEGMIKAGCEDINSSKDRYSYNDHYAENYDPLTGWGFVRADELFEMIRNRGYKLVHLHYYDTTSFTKTNLGTQTIYFRNPGYSIQKYWIIPSGLYNNVTVWQIDGTITIPGNWLHNEDNPLFVWGRSGGSNKSGLDKFYSGEDNNEQLTTYQSGYTQVTDGEHGNQLVDGIYHNEGLTVHVRTYQYELTINNETIKLPPDDELGTNISVFGIQETNNIKEEENNTEQFFAYISPNPVIDKFKVNLDVKVPLKLKFEIYDCLGNNLFTLDDNKIYSGSSNVIFNAVDIPAGVYFLKINSNFEIKTLKFIVGGK